MSRRTKLGARLVLYIIRSYKRLISPLFTGSCRFLPSCSDYMAEAVERHGAIAGVGLGLARLGRCHPFGDSGLDPVPQQLRSGRRILRETACDHKHAIVAPAGHPNAAAASGAPAEGQGPESGSHTVPAAEVSGAATPLAWQSAPAKRQRTC